MVGKSHLRGTVDVSRLADWQRAEMLRKQQSLVENQENLRKQIEERAQIKAMQLAKQKEEERKEEERINREQRELADKYSREKNSESTPAVEKQLSPEEQKAVKEEQKQKAKDEAAEKYLKAQREAEELKKSKFKAKRALAQQLSNQALPEAVNDSHEFQVQEQPAFVQQPRRQSPPIPTVKARMSNAQLPLSANPPQEIANPLSMSANRTIATQIQNSQSFLPPTNSFPTLPPETFPSVSVFAANNYQQPPQFNASPIPQYSAPNHISWNQPSSVDTKTKSVLQQLATIKQVLLLVSYPMRLISIISGIGEGKTAAAGRNAKTCDPTR